MGVKETPKAKGSKTMVRIRITPNQIHHVASNFARAAEESRNIASWLQDEMGALGAEWDGVTQERFYQEWQRWHSDTLRGSELLLGIAQQLRVIAARFEAADQGF